MFPQSSSNPMSDGPGAGAVTSPVKQGQGNNNLAADISNKKNMCI